MGARLNRIKSPPSLIQLPSQQRFSGWHSKTPRLRMPVCGAYLEVIGCLSNAFLWLIIRERRGTTWTCQRSRSRSSIRLTFHLKFVRAMPSSSTETLFTVVPRTSRKRPGKRSPSSSSKHTTQDSVSSTGFGILRYIGSTNDTSNGT